MVKNQWLRGLAVSLSVAGLSSLSYGQNYGQNYAYPGSGLAPSSFPTPYVPVYPNNPQPQMVNGNGYPYYAQNPAAPAVPTPNSGHVHVLQGNVNASDVQPGVVPSLSGSPTQAQPSHTIALPAVDNSMPVQSSHTTNVPSTAPITKCRTNKALHRPSHTHLRNRCR